jgi:hypothetical protein
MSNYYIMSNEESILNGIIDNNIKYFIEKFDITDKPNPCFKEYFNDYIGGDLVDVDEVYKNIVTNFDEKILDICEHCLTDDLYLTFFKGFLDYLQGVSINYIEIYKILLKSTKIADIIISESVIFYSICDKVIKNDLQETDDVFNLFITILKNKNIRPHILDYFNYRIDICKRGRDLMNIMDITYPYILEKFKANSFNLKLILVILKLWTHGITTDKLIRINDKETNFLSIGFYQLHKLLEYGLITIYEEKDFRIKESIKIKNRLKESNPYDKHILTLLDNKLETRLKHIHELISNKKVIRRINDFYGKTMCWINNSSVNKDKECVDDILENVYIFIKNNKSELNDNLTEMIVGIFSNNSTKNPNIKINYLNLFNAYLYDIIDDNIRTTGLQNFISWDTNINKIMGSILDLSHDMKKSFNNDEIYNMLYPMSVLTNVFNLTIYNLEDYRYHFDQDKNDKYFKELIYDNLNNFQFVVDEILGGLIKINGIESGTILLSDEKQIEIEDEKDKINNLRIYLDIFSKFIIKSCKYHIKVVLSSETRHCFGNILVSLMTNLTVHQKRYKVKDKVDLKFSPIDILITLKSIFLSIIVNRDDEAILVNLIGEHDGYVKNSVLRIINILIKKDEIKSLEYSYLSYFDNKINVKIDSNVDIEIPDELCDPLMDTLIENPVMLPNDIIIDLGTISRHLLTSETNPFDRTPLTMELLEEYNKKPCVKLLIDEFKLKLKEFSERI